MASNPNMELTAIVNLTYSSTEAIPHNVTSPYIFHFELQVHLDYYPAVK